MGTSRTSGIRDYYLLISDYLFSWPVSLLLLMPIFSFFLSFFKVFFLYFQNKVAEIRGEKIGVGRLARSVSLGPLNHFHKLTPLKQII